MDSTVLPRDHLRACILLVLGEEPAHGYDLPALLAPLGLGGADRGFVYRTLRSMDAEGVVASSWDVSPAGPSRRMYRVTPAGRRWAVSVSAGLGEVDRVMATWLARYRLLTRRDLPAVSEVSEVSAAS